MPKAFLPMLFPQTQGYFFLPSRAVVPRRAFLFASVLALLVLPRSWSTGVVVSMRSSIRLAVDCLPRESRDEEFDVLLQPFVVLDALIHLFLQRWRRNIFQQQFDSEFGVTVTESTMPNTFESFEKI